jgi:hypothetical protein
METRTPASRPRKILVNERDTTMNDLLEVLVACELTEAEWEQREQQSLEEARQTTGAIVSDDARTRSFLQRLARDHHAA